MSIKVGDKAPHFALRSSDTSEVSLSDYDGQPLVILFFPLAFTGVCTAELCSVRDELAVYSDMNANVVGISVDSPFVLAKFKEEHSYNFPLLSDFNKDISRAYGALYEEFVLGLRGVSKRSAFVIDRDGVVRYAEVLDNAGEVPDFDKIKAVVSEL